MILAKYFTNNKKAAANTAPLIAASLPIPFTSFTTATIAAKAIAIDFTILPSASGSESLSVICVIPAKAATNTVNPAINFAEFERSVPANNLATIDKIKMLVAIFLRTSPSLSRFSAEDSFTNKPYAAIILAIMPIIYNSPVNPCLNESGSFIELINLTDADIISNAVEIATKPFFRPSILIPSREIEVDKVPILDIRMYNTPKTTLNLIIPFIAESKFPPASTFANTHTAAAMIASPSAISFKPSAFVLKAFALICLAKAFIIFGTLFSIF